ncbi:MAG: glycosyltransferase family 2 protein [Bacteroidales bacterium]|nr:glycosyltransferase family 2 protein [Bacteroidales bacterium]MDY0315613.1 glycosyltransferase family 2 protein [Bacteroidales bacterium]
MKFLNICIPCFNHDISKLVEDIYNQCSNENIEFQIIVFEDGSSNENVKKNSVLTEKFKIKHIISEINIGRSAARNRLANESKTGKIIFLDADSSLANSDFINKYLQNFNNEIVCGGTLYHKKQNIKSQSLRYKFGINREMKTAKHRAKKPNASFATNNFMISTNIFELIQFREFLKDYGHEDSLFGYELKKNKLIISHIDNPVVHEGLESNEIFLNKTNLALKNLILIEASGFKDKDFIYDIKLAKIAKNLKTFKLIFIIRFFNSIFKNKIKNHLLNSGNPNLFIFDFYKLAYYCELKRKNYV